MLIPDPLDSTSSTDRSLRAYDSATGTLLAREHGQLAISGIAYVKQNDNHDYSPAFVIT